MKQQGNQRLPLLSLQNRKVKNENSNMNKGNKNTDQNCNIFNIYNPYSVPMETDDNKHMNANLMSVKPLSVNGKSDVRMQISEKEDSSVGEVQYNKVLGKALQEAIDENDYLRKRIEEILSENKDLKSEIEDKNGALLELAQFYEFCSKNHGTQQRDNSEDRKLRKKRKSKSL